jgi:Fe-S cluster assembly iron-binding protein IscA
VFQFAAILIFPKYVGLTQPHLAEHGGEHGRYHLRRSGTTEISDERNPTVLTLTDNAATEIRNLVAQPELPDDAGVRIASGPEGALTLALAGQPGDGDAVVEDRGARLFVEREAGQILDDMCLDAGVDPQGNVQFSIGQQG